MRPRGMDPIAYGRTAKAELGGRALIALYEENDQGTERDRALVIYGRGVGAFLRARMKQAARAKSNGRAVA